MHARYKKAGRNLIRCWLSAAQIARKIKTRSEPDVLTKPF
jgi:hypothetical protein